MSRNEKLLSLLDALFEGGIWLLLLFSPLLVGVGNLDAYRTIQATFSLVLVLFLVGVWAVKVTLTDQWSRLMSLPLFWPILAFLLWAFFSLFGAPSFALGGQSFLALVAFVLFYFAVSQWASTEERRVRILIAMAIPLFLNSVLGLLQYNRVDIQAWGNALPSVPLFQNYIAGLAAPSRLGSAAGVLGNQNVLGGYMIGPLMATMALLWVELKSRRAFPLAALCILGFFCLFATMTRGAWVGMGGGILFFLGFLAVRFRASLWRRRGLLIGALAGLLILTAVGVQVVGPQRISQRFSDLHTFSQRQYVWNVAHRMANERPILGQGLGSFKVLYFRTLVKEYPQGIPDLLHHRYVQAHNDFIQTAAELGYPGLVLLLGGLAAFFWERSRRLFSLPARESILGAGELGGLLAILVGGVTGFPFHIAASAVVFAALAGVVASRGQAPWSETVPENSFLWLQCAGTVVLALTLMGMVFFQYQSDVLVKQSLASIQRQELDAAEQSLRRAIAYDAARGDARVHLGFILAMQGRPSEAKPYLEESCATYDDVSTHFYLGFVYRALGQLQEARREYRNALSYYPVGHPNRAVIDQHLQSLEASKGGQPR